MTFYEDLTDYNYGRTVGSHIAQNVGWLDSEHAFTTGLSADGFLPKLRRYCNCRAVQHLGIHECPLCKRFVRDEQGRYLGTAEIRVVLRNERAFASPDLILHYVDFHNYLPPREFIDAVFTFDPTPGSDDYFQGLVPWIGERGALIAKQVYSATHLQ